MARSQELTTWTMTTCERNRQSCELAGELWVRVKDKSVRSVAVLTALLREQLGTQPLSISAFLATPAGSPPGSIDTGTLLPTDLVMDWRGRLPSTP